MDSSVINTISLCSGVGMLDEGFAAGLRHLGIDCRTILYAEREAYPCSVLESRMEEGSIHPAPIWCGDFTQLDGRQFRGVVDAIVAGFPCPPVSVAGKRLGADDERWLWDDIINFANECDARFIFVENVRGILNGPGYSACGVCGWSPRWGGHHWDYGKREWLVAERGHRDDDFRQDSTQCCDEEIRRHHADTQATGRTEFDSGISPVAEQICDETTSGSGIPLFAGEEGTGPHRFDNDGAGRPIPCCEEEWGEELDCGADAALAEGERGYTGAEFNGAEADSGRIYCGACGEPMDSERGRSLRGTLGDVQWSLAQSGFSSEWITISASDVGASHGRDRWFCFAWRMANPGSGKLPKPGRRQEGRNGAGSAEHALVNTEHAGLSAAGIEKSISEGNDRCPSGKIDACESTGSGVAGGQVEPAESFISRELSSRNEPGNTGLEGPCCELGESKRTRWPTARSRHSLDTRGESEQGCCYMADTRKPGFSERERIRCFQSEEVFAYKREATERGCSLFAPGPSDPRWSDIIREQPERAPALEPSFCSVVNGLAFDMGDCRAARLKCIGNGVVPLQAAVAAVVLIERSGILKETT